MPQWTSDLPPVPAHHGYQLTRTPADAPLRALITCEHLFLCPTHFWGGRTVPCESPACPACDAGSPLRMHCYVSALLAKTREHIIFECTAIAAVPLDEWYQHHQTLRGCQITAARPKRRRNAKVEITCQPFDLTKITLPPAPDIPKIMATIWQLPSSAVSTPEETPGVLPISTDSRIARAMRENELYAKQTSGNGRNQKQ